LRRADRLYRLVELLRGGRLTTARRLAERLEVSERTIYRDIADLMASGVPIDGEAGVGYVMRPGFDVPPIMFTREEITALVAGARLMQAWGGAEMARSATEALGKITAVIPAEIARAADSTAVHAFRTPDLDGRMRQRLDMLDAGIRTPTRFVMDYRDEAGAETRRAVRPLGLVFWGKVWTLIAWCELRTDFRMFRIDRILAAEAAGPFTPESGRTLADFYAQEVPPEACDWFTGR
jgi:predicted DNA-binding transcriptional regulator YafY